MKIPDIDHVHLEIRDRQQQLHLVLRASSDEEILQSMDATSRLTHNDGHEYRMSNKRQLPSRRISS